MEHKALAIDLFNKTWDLLDNPHRTPQQDALMITMAHTSLYHWTHVGTDENRVIGHWQVSRVYASLTLGESALIFAKQTLQLCLDHGITGFNLAYAYEAMARSCSLTKDFGAASWFLELARLESESIVFEADRKLLLDDLKTIQLS